MVALIDVFNLRPIVITTISFVVCCYFLGYYSNEDKVNHAQHKNRPCGLEISRKIYYIINADYKNNIDILFLFVPAKKNRPKAFHGLKNIYESIHRKI